MFYVIKAYNQTALHAWASDPADIERYIDWLNRERDVNLYSATSYTEEEWLAAGHDTLDDAMSCDEPHWDDFTSEEE